MPRDARIRLFLAALMWAPSFRPAVSAEAEEVLVERTITEQEEKYFGVRTFEKDVTGYADIELVKETYSRVAKRPGIIKLVLVYDEENDRPISVRVTTLTLKPAATIYERELPKELLERYDLVPTADGPELRRDMTLDEIRRKYGPAYWDRKWGVQKVEVFFRGEIQGEYTKEPGFRLIRLVGRRKKIEAEKQAEAAWIKGARERLAIGQDTAGYKHLKTEFEVLDRHDVGYKGPIARGRVRESFRNERSDVDVTVVEWPNDHVPEHEFLRPIIDFDPHNRDTKGFVLKRTSIGYVFICRHYEGGRGSPFPKLDKVRVTWVSRNLSVTVAAQGKYRVRTLLKVFGKRFPSTLKRRGIDADKIEWHRREVELILARLKRLVASEEPTQVDWYSHNFDMLLTRVRIPGYSRSVAYKASAARKKALYDEVAKWWSENKGDVLWNSEHRKLVPGSR